MYISPNLQSTITGKDLFCGAGGSTKGATSVPGVTIVMASNHDPRAIETHTRNFPHIDHDLIDIRKADPRRYPRTTFLIASPECRGHSQARGKKRDGAQLKLDLEVGDDGEPDEEIERSRATMEEVVKFTEYHRYEFVIIENVAEVRNWIGFDQWHKKMLNLGYESKFVFLNSRFAHVRPPENPTPDSYAPQSRDRLYVVFWKRGNKPPDLDIRPFTYCPHCANHVDAIQSFKKQSKSRTVMMHGKQYDYRCPRCAEVVTPYYFAAANAIDWSDPGTKVKDRIKKPLELRTKARIGSGGTRFANQALVIPLAYTHGHNDRAVPVADPFPTQSASNTTGVAMPFFIHTNHDGERRPIMTTEALPAQTARQVLGVAQPPFIIDHLGEYRVRSIDDPLSTLVGSGNHHSVVTPQPFLTVQYSPGYNLPVTEAMGAITTQDHHGLVTPPFIVEMYNTGDARGVDEPLSAITAQGNHHYLVNPPFMVEMYGQSTVRGVDQPLSAITSVPHHGLVVPHPFLISFYKNPIFKKAWEDAMGTLTALDRHGLVQSERLPDLEPGSPEWIEECYFRMLKWEEIRLGMGFSPDYVITGNNREKVKQLGNAVTPVAMRELIKRCVAALE